MPVRTDDSTDTRRPALKQIGGLTAKAVQEALDSSSRLWLYRVNSFAGNQETGWIAFSRDYLVNIVAQRLSEDRIIGAMPDGADWLKSGLPLEIDRILKRHNVRAGYAVLEGVTRPVWAIPQADLKLDKGKTLRPIAVEVRDKL